VSEERGLGYNEMSRQAGKQDGMDAVSALPFVLSSCPPPESVGCWLLSSSSIASPCSANTAAFAEALCPYIPSYPPSI